MPSCEGFLSTKDIVLGFRSRTQLDSAGVRLILGVNGGVCANCVLLCQSVIDEATAKENAKPG